MDPTRTDKPASGPFVQDTAVFGTPIVVKRWGRLRIVSRESGEEIYCPPLFLIVSHPELWRLAEEFAHRRTRCIRAIMQFEKAARPA